MAVLADAAGTTGTLAELTRYEERRFLARQPRSLELTERAKAHLAGGATSSWMIARPAAVWVHHGSGSKVYDADGTEYVDLHAGYGAMVAGHGHPAVVEAVSRRVRLGTHFAQPTEDAIVVAELLAERFGLPLWRFTNSGSEATMDAVHLMRAITGRDLIVKIEGSYHGHHDLLNVSLWRDLDQLGDFVLRHGHGRGQKIFREQEEAHHAKAEIAHVGHLGPNGTQVKRAPHVHGAAPGPVVAAELEASARGGHRAASTRW
jgi:glutamate-1-semialdehyde aminotransferase